MPSKYKIGNSPLGRRIRNTSSPMSGFAQVEREIGHAQSVPNLVTRSRQLPNGMLHLPGRAQGGATTKPWRVSLNKTDQGYTARILEGDIWEGLLNVTKKKFETEEVEGVTQSVGQNSAVVAEDVVCIKYTYQDGATPDKLEFEIFAAGEEFADWTPIIENEPEDPEEDPIVIASRYPLAKIINTAEEGADPVLSAEQLASHHLALAGVCYNGTALTSLVPF